MEGAEVVHGEAADFLGDFDAAVVGPTDFHIIMNKGGYVTEAIVVAIARGHFLLDGGSQFVGTFGEINHQLAHGFHAVVGFVALGA